MWYGMGGAVLFLLTSYSKSAVYTREYSVEYNQGKAGSWTRRERAGRGLVRCRLAGNGAGAGTGMSCVLKGPVISYHMYEIVRSEVAIVSATGQDLGRCTFV